MAGKPGRSGPRPLGDRPMTNTERQRRHQQKRRDVIALWWAAQWPALAPLMGGTGEESRGSEPPEEAPLSGPISR